LKKLLLNLYYWPAFLLVTLVGLSLLPFILLFNKIFYGRKLAHSLRLAIRFYGWVLVCVVPFMAPVKVIGETEKIPAPAIFVANHNSAIDPYLFGAIPAENCFVTSWPFKIPIYRLFMKLAGYIDTADGWELIREKCAQHLKEGVSVIIWPEGHRSRTGKIGRFRRGAFQLSVETGVPIQPVCITGSGNIMSPGQKLLNPGKVSLILLDPVYPPENEKPQQDRINEMRQDVFGALQECTDRFQRPHYPASLQAKREETSAPPESLNRHPHDCC